MNVHRREFLRCRGHLSGAVQRLSRNRRNQTCL